MGLRVLRNVSLGKYNYLRFAAAAETFAFLEDRSGIRELCELVKSADHFKVIGDGSNVLLKVEEYPLFIQASLKGVEFTSHGKEVFVKANAGESWSELVDLTAARGLYGIESLALIPGSVGAAPVQNIGAYGQEVGNVIQEVEVLDLQTGMVRSYTAAQCQFAYRSSVFKTKQHRYDLILSVTMKLSSEAPPSAVVNGSIETPIQIAERIKQTRRSKLPDPDVHPNVGSFFHNPVVSKVVVERIKADHQNVPVFPHGDKFKIPAAWLIEAAGWKGHRAGDVGVSDKHALVFINYGSTLAMPLFSLANKVIEDVERKFGIRLNIEPATFE